MYGLPQRKQDFKLKGTLFDADMEEQPKPYRIFNKDDFLS